MSCTLFIVAYQTMDVSTHIKSDKVKILTGEQELVSVDNGTRIDYTKSDEKLVLGDREVAMLMMQHITSLWFRMLNMYL